MFSIYYPNWINAETNPVLFGTVEEAIQHALLNVSHETHSYMIGTDSVIDAIVFMGRVYRPVEDVAA